MAKKFLRTGSLRYKKLGRKNKLRWRKPRGRHNKIREKRKGRLRKVEIGYRKSSVERNKINGKIPFIVRNLKDLDKVEKKAIVILAKLGKKKIIQILERANEKEIKILNLKKFVKEKNESK